MLEIAYAANFQLQQGATPTVAAKTIARACTKRKDPVLSSPELVDVENVAVPKDLAVLQRVKRTRLAERAGPGSSRVAISSPHHSRGASGIVRPRGDYPGSAVRDVEWRLAWKDCGAVRAGAVGGDLDVWRLLVAAIEAMKLEGHSPAVTVLSQHLEGSHSGRVRRS